MQVKASRAAKEDGPWPQNEELREQIRIVALFRQEHDRQQERLKSLRAQWAEEHAIEIEEARWAEESKTLVEAKLREMTLADFAATGNKAPAPGVGVRIVTRLLYEAGEAFAWAKEHGLALKLDEKAFEKITRATPLPFVRYEDSPQATIATDLMAAVAEIEKEAR